MTLGMPEEMRDAVYAPPRSLVRKLSEIMASVTHVAKDGRNAFHGYDYATEAAIAAAVRGEMAKRHVMLIPSVEKTEWSKVQTKSGEDRLCTLTVRFTLEDGDSGETRSYVVVGEGTDRGDKASYKAMTGAEKYALLKLFLIPTGDDPEKDDAGTEPQKKERTTHAPAARFEKNAVAVDAAKNPDPASAPLGHGPIIPWGKDKGKHASEVDAKSLRWLINAARKNLDDPSKAKWHESNKELHDGLIAVAQSRGEE